MTYSLELNSHQFTLHHHGAAFWHQEDMLLIADVHLGKATHFRKHGIPVPQDVAHHNFQKLDELIAFFNPKVVCFLGDLFHSFLNSEWQLFEQWIQRQSNDFLLITGNHDILPAERYETLGIQLEDRLLLHGFSLTHHPEDIPDTLNVCGHVHPGVRLKGTGKQSMRLPCFYQTPERLMLPAFGAFTGKFIVQPTQKDSVFVLVNQEVIPFGSSHKKSLH